MGAAPGPGSGADGRRSEAEPRGRPPFRPSDRSADPLLEEVVDVETYVGPMLLPVADQVITGFLLRNVWWETHETTFFATHLRPGQVFVDVGAHVGYYTVMASKLVGPTGSVVCFEPEERNLDLLERNLWRNGCSNVLVVPEACSDREGPMSLVLDEVNRGAHHLAPPGVGVPVWSVRPDSVVSGRVDYVKIDAQGYDHEVVAGLEGVWSANPDVTIVVEVSFPELEARGVAAIDVLTGYEDLGFEIAHFDLEGGLRTMPARALEPLLRRTRRTDVNVVLTRRGAARSAG